MNTNGWDMISVLNINQVNQQLEKRFNELVMRFNTHWNDGFAGQCEAQGTFGTWSITGGSGSDIYLMLPIKSGSVSQQNPQGKLVDISGIVVTIEVNLEWVPQTVNADSKILKFDLRSITMQGTTRQPGGIYVISVRDPRNTGFGKEIGNGVAHTLLDNKDKISFVFAQTGVIDTSTATWLNPKKSTYSYHAPQGSDNHYLAILSVTSDRDISNLSSNIDSDIVSSSFPLSLAISGNLFLENAILPALPGAFQNADSNTFAYSNGSISLANGLDLKSIRQGSTDFTPKIKSMTMTIDANALKSTVLGSVDLPQPNAHLSFSVATTNVLAFDPSNETFSLKKDANPTIKTSSHVPWYDYLITLGTVSAGSIGIVLAVPESGLSNSLSTSAFANSLANLPATTVKWSGLDQVSVQAAGLNDCFFLRAHLS
jgi:hypothetical protein